MYKKHTYTKEKQCKEKTKQKKPNKQTSPPPPKKKQKKNIFMFCLNLFQDAKILFRFLLFEEKKRGIWLRSMTQTVTQGATPVRLGADKHVTKQTGVTGQLVYQYGLSEPVYGSIIRLLRTGGGRRGGGRRESGERWGDWREGKRGKFCARRSEGGGGKGWETKFYNEYPRYHFKRNEKYSDPLSSPKLFLWFCSSWLYFTHLEF